MNLTPYVLDLFYPFKEYLWNLDKFKQPDFYFTQVHQKRLDHMFLFFWKIDVEKSNSDLTLKIFSKKVKSSTKF